jgi:hypothetical protein
MSGPLTDNRAWSQEDFAYRATIDRSYIGRVERTIFVADAHRELHGERIVPNYSAFRKRNDPPLRAKYLGPSASSFRRIP